MLLLVAFVAGCGNVWGAEETIESNFTDKNATVGTGELQWTVTNSNSFETSGNARGLQSAKNTTNFVFTSNKTQTEALGAIKKIVITASANANQTINVTVGGAAFGSSTSLPNKSANVDFTFTGSASGQIVVTISRSSSSTAWVKKIVVTYDSSSDPSINADDVDIAYNATEGEISYTLSNPVDGAAVSASSDDEWISNIAVNESTKKVTFSATANTVAAKRTGTITLSYTKGDEELATKAVTVTQAKAVVMLNYTLATQIIPGKHYIITSGTDGDIMAMGYQNTSNRPAVAITASDGTASIESDAGVYEFVIGGDETTGYYTIYDEVNEGYLYAASSSSNHLKNKAEIDANCKWTITFGDDDVATVTAKGTYTHNLMRYNSSGTGLFSCYASGQNDIYLFVRDGDESTQQVNATIAAACTDGKGKYYGTYSNPFPFIVPADVTVSEISVVDGELLIENYKTGDVVPANTGVMLSATSAGNKALTLSVGGTSALGSDNMLRATGKAGLYSNKMNADDANCKFYRLTMHNGTALGFWWGAENGAAFDYETPNRAYLAVPNTAAAAKGGFLLFDETTGIKSLPQATSLKGDTEWYNLAGQRVAAPQKGIYIKNGKKVSVK